jgi:hypothetical protein
MDIVEFKKQLKSVGVSLNTLYARAYPDRGLELARLLSEVKDAKNFRDLITDLFAWGNTPEGFDFWQAVSMGEKPEEADIPDPVSKLKFEIGERVKHPIYGVGTIVKIDPDDESTPYRVCYDRGGLTLWDSSRDVTAIAPTPQDTHTEVSDPSQKQDSGKRDLALIPLAALEAEAEAFEVGERKYKRYGYYYSDLEATRIVAAAIRHLYAWLDGEERCPEDGQPHLGSARACTAMILQLQKQGVLNDNRFKGEVDVQDKE